MPTAQTRGPASRPALELDCRVTRPSFDAHYALQLEPGSVLAVMGANGSGKSTLMASLAGTLRPDSGRIAIGGHTVFDSAEGIFVPPARRNVALLGQEPLLFPHLSVLANVAYGPRARGAGKAQSREQALGWLDAVGLAQFEARRPQQLSGGQAARVALARALALSPQLLLLDEPFAALDVRAASAMRALVARVLAQTGTSALLVTHNALDALALTDSTLILEGGEQRDLGPNASVLERPRTEFAAHVMGMNYVSGTLQQVQQTYDGGSWRLKVGDYWIDGQLAAGGHPESAAASAVFSPSAVRCELIAREQADSASVQVMTVDLIEPASGGIRVNFREVPALFAQLGTASGLVGQLKPGARVAVDIDASQVAIVPSPASGTWEGSP